ncbi:MAG: hypothetical protein A2Y77_05100 [Planctomycetes bacterium RBG_13_62_9]|nr:MAG: hypothetical protein A2Y77_05100 [Planctomycetes bacterium RBG_13_62_9]
MANPEQMTFRCDLIDPTGRLLGCEATSVILPAHDGQVGILYDHMPMLCQLGLGIMTVTPASADVPKEAAQSELQFFIDGGFALVAENTVTVIAADALSLQEAQAKKIESMMDKTAKSIASPALSPSQRTHESNRLRTLQKIAEARRGE